MRTSSHNTTCWLPGLPQLAIFPQLAPSTTYLQRVPATTQAPTAGPCSQVCTHNQLWSLLQLVLIPSCWEALLRIPMRPLPTACCACQGPISGWCYECKRLSQYNHIIELSNILLKNFQLSSSFLTLIFRWDSPSYVSYLNKMYLSL